MSSQAVPWRRVTIVVVVAVVALGGAFLALRADGFRSLDAAVPRATRWFVHDETDQLILADGFSGRALFRLDSTLADGSSPAEIVQSASGVSIIDRNAATAQEMDATTLRLGSPQPVNLVQEPDAVVGIGTTGLVAVDPEPGRAVLLPPGGDPIPFDVADGAERSNTRISPDGAVWSLTQGSLHRTNTTSAPRFVTGLSAQSRFALVGNEPLVFDTGGGRVSMNAGTWVELPGDIAVSEVVLQEDGPAASCGWLGAEDRLWCIGESGIEHEQVIPELDIDGGDLLAIAGDAAVLIRDSRTEIVRLDWRRGTVIEAPAASVPASANLSVSASPDLIWVDDRNGDDVWAINPWGVRVIQKDDRTAPLLGEGGEVVDEGGSGRASAGIGNDAGEGNQNAPDDNGIDDEPIAIDDAVSARTGGQVRVEVTANDYDPDGEAIVVVDTTDPSRGQVEITSASTVTYRPDTGFVGIDTFEYTIADGNGTEASATVTVELLSADAPNRGPTGRPDSSETGRNVPVVIDVLLNDIDPERDALRIDSFTLPELGGTITELPAPSGLPGLRYEPELDASGTASFTYTPVDALGAVGEPVDVEVEIAAPTADNRAPIVQPDSLLVRRDQVRRLPVLANDRDPDGDRLALSLPREPPGGIQAVVDGNDLVIVARAGAARLSPFEYQVDDGNGNIVEGSVLVALIDEQAPNAAPVANPDAATAVVGTPKLIDVLANDDDPDGDTPILVSVRREGDAGAVRVRGERIEYIAAPLDSGDEQRLDRFEYTITDGKGGQDTGEVSVRVLPERIAEPPWAQDDAATTTTNVPVTLDVLRNDGDPSGEQPTLFGSPACQGGGTATITADDRVTFTPPTDQVGLFTCGYRVVNSAGNTDNATITINVVEPDVTNQAPVVRGERRTVRVGATVVVDVLANDSDPDDDELTVVDASTPTQGSLEWAPSGIVEYTAGPTPDFVTITYQVSDTEGNTTPGDVVFEIVPPDPVPPSAAPDSRTVTAPAPPTTIDVVQNDDDPDGDPSDLRVTAVGLASGDATVTSSDTTITVSPDDDFVGVVVVNYTITDADGLTASSTVTVTVLEAPNAPPVARDDSAEVVSGGTVTVPLAVNDVDPDGDQLVYRIVAPPESSLGLASLEGANLVFTAAAGASGEAVIVYEIDDGEETARATVRIRVLACSQGAPEAPDLFYTTGYQQPIAIDLRSEVANGEVVEVGPPLSQAVGTYTPPAGENGNVTFTYVVRNSCRVTATGTVTIDVNQDPDGVGLYEASIGRRQRVVIPIIDLASDDEPLTIVGLRNQPAWATVAGNGSQIVLDPNGAAGQFEFDADIADPGGLQVEVTIQVRAVNLAPAAVGDTVESAGGAVSFSPLQNDSDPDGDAISLGLVPSTFTFESGVVGTIDQQAGNTLLLDPKGGSGRATFTYTIVDALGRTSQPATVTFIVNGPPSTPDQTSATIQAGESGSVTIAASDPDGDPLTVTILGDPSPLGVGVDGFAVQIAVPAGTGGNQYQIQYRVSDPSGAFDDGVIVVSAGVPPTTTTIAPTTTTTVAPSTTVAPTTVPPTSAPVTLPPPPGGGG